MRITAFFSARRPFPHDIRWRRWVRVGLMLCLLLGSLGALGGRNLRQERAAAAEGPVYVLEVRGIIDLGLAPYLRRVLNEAKEQGARAVVLEIATPGGRLDAALDMRDALLGSHVTTIAFINREAYSAGALIAISTERIYMAPGAVVGAATPVTGAGEVADEKTISAVRSAFRGAAEARGLDPQIAEAMVDPSVEVPGLVGPEQLLTLTSKEALAWGYAKGETSNMEAVLEAEGMGGSALVTTTPGLAEMAVRFVTNPAVASLLISLGFLGLLIELQTPGFGAGGIVGLSALATFFWGHHLAGLAGWEGIALAAVGAVLLALELIVIPGFGVAGALGIAAFLGGVYLSLVGRIPTGDDYLQALQVIIASIVMVLVGGYLSLRLLPKRALGGLVLTTRLASSTAADAGEGVSVADRASHVSSGERNSLVGATGTAVTDLRPSGMARIGARRIDVVAEEGYLPAGTEIEVIADESYRRVVRAVSHE